MGISVILKKCLWVLCIAQIAGHLCQQAGCEWVWNTNIDQGISKSIQVIFIYKYIHIYNFVVNELYIVYILQWNHSKNAIRQLISQGYITFVITYLYITFSYSHLLKETTGVNWPSVANDICQKRCLPYLFIRKSGSQVFYISWMPHDATAKMDIKITGSVGNYR